MTNTNGLPPSEFDDAPQEGLTPAARKLLDEYLSEYQHRLLSEAKRSATRDADRTIRLADLRSAEFAISRTLGKFDSTSWFMRRAGLLVAAVVMTAAGGLVGFTINAVSADTNQGLTEALVAIAGVAAAAVATSIAVLRIRTFQTIATGARDLLISVADLERQARALASQLAGAPSNGQSLSRVIDALEAERVWSTADVAAFRDVMKLRNQYVYEQRTESSSVDVLAAMRTVGRLSEALAEYEEESTSDHRHQSRGRALEHQVYQALTRNLNFSVARTLDSRADFLIEAPGATVAVLVKSRRGRHVGIKDVQDWLALEKDDLNWATVVVTDGSLSTELLDLGSIQTRTGRSVRVVKWDGATSISPLLRSLRRVVDSEIEARSTHMATSEGLGTIEIYTDGAGKFRFRLKVSNGRIVAVSEAYDSKAAALAAIETLQRSSMAAQVRDRTA